MMASGQIVVEIVNHPLAPFEDDISHNRRMATV